MRRYSYLGFFIFFLNSCYSQKIEFIYEYEVCYESKIIQQTSYDSKTGIYREINFDRTTFIDTKNVDEEKFEAIIPLDSFQRKRIDEFFLNSEIKKNKLKNYFFGNYELNSILFYKQNSLINNDSQYINDEKEHNQFKELKYLILNFIEASTEYKTIFKWRNVKK